MRSRAPDDRFRPLVTLGLIALALALLGGAGWLHSRYAHRRRPAAHASATQTLPDADEKRRALTRAVVRAAHKRRPSASKDRPAARVPPLVEALQLRLAALKDEPAGRGIECLAKLDRADAIAPDKATRWQYLRSLCELRAGRCEDGRKRLERTLRARTPPSAQASIAARLQALVDSRCPATVGAPVDRVRRLLRALPRERLLGHLQTCRAQGQELVALWQKLGPTVRAPLAPAFHNATIDAAKCSGWLNHCGEAWTLWRAAYRRRFQASLPEAHIRRMARAAFPKAIHGCTPPAAPAPPRRPSPPPRPR